MADQPTDPRQTEQDLRKGEVEIRKLTAEAQSAEVASIVPTLPTDIPTGKLDVGEQASPLGVCAAYRSLSSIGTEIVKVIPDDVEHVWIIPNDVISKHRAIHENVTTGLRRAGEEIKNASDCLPDPQRVIAAPLVALSFAAAALPAVASLLRRNTTIRSTAVTLTFTSVAAAVAKELLKRPSKPKVTIEGMPSPSSTALLTQLQEVTKSRDELAQKLARYRAENVDEPGPDLAAANEKFATLKLLAAERAKLGNNVPPFEEVLSQVEAAAREVSEQRKMLVESTRLAAYAESVIKDATAVLNGIQTIDSTGVTPLQIAEVYEACKQAHVLLLEPSYGGGESTYEEIPMKKDRGAHYGSAVVSYMLANKDAEIIETGTACAFALANTEVGSENVRWAPPLGG